MRTTSRLRHKTKMFFCSERGCGRGFTRNRALKAHLVGYHRNEKPHQCQSCEKRFVRDSDRRKHEKRVHEGVADFVCKANGCSAAYATMFELNRHLKRFPQHGFVQNHFDSIQTMEFNFLPEGTSKMDIEAFDFSQLVEDSPTTGVIGFPVEIIMQHREDAGHWLVGCGAWADTDIERWQHEYQDEHPSGERLPIFEPGSSKVTGDFPATIDDLCERTAKIIKFEHCMTLLDTPRLWIAPNSAFGDPEFKLRKPSPVAVSDEDLKEQLMRSIEVSIPLYDIFQVKIDLDSLNSEIVNKFRRIRGYRVEDLENGVNAVIQKEIFKSLKKRDVEEYSICNELEKEYTEFSRLRSVTENNLSAIAKAVPHAHIWNALLVKQNESGKEAKVEFQRDIIFLIKQIYQKKYGPLGLTMSWFEDTISYALVYRSSCKSVRSGHTNSILESLGLRTASHCGDQAHWQQLWELEDRQTRLARVTDSLRLFGFQDTSIFKGDATEILAF